MFVQVSVFFFLDGVDLTAEHPPKRDLCRTEATCRRPPALGVVSPSAFVGMLSRRRYFPEAVKSDITGSFFGRK
jgi:hypothetical protein